jgi:hypothetical protein
VVVNPQLRASRLASSLPSYLLHSAITLVRAYATYRPLAVFSLVGALFLAVGTAGIARFVYYYVTEGGAGHVQSVMLAATLWAVGVMIVLSGLQADLVAANRRLAEEAIYELRRRASEPRSRRGRLPRALVRNRQPARRVRQPAVPLVASDTAAANGQRGAATRGRARSTDAVPRAPALTPGAESASPLAQADGSSQDVAAARRAEGCP